MIIEHNEGNRMSAYMSVTNRLDGGAYSIKLLEDKSVVECMQ